MPTRKTLRQGYRTVDGREVPAHMMTVHVSSDGNSATFASDSADAALFDPMVDSDVLDVDTDDFSDLVGEGSFSPSSVYSVGPHDVDEVNNAALEAALEMPNENPWGDEMFGEDYDLENFDDLTVEMLREDSVAFMTENKDALRDFGSEEIGRRFWQSRNGHDGFLEDGREDLHEAAKRFGPVELWAGPDEKIHSI